MIDQRYEGVGEPGAYYINEVTGTRYFMPDNRDLRPHYATFNRTKGYVNQELKKLHLRVRFQPITPGVTNRRVGYSMQLTLVYRGSIIRSIPLSNNMIKLYTIQETLRLVLKTAMHPKRLQKMYQIDQMLESSKAYEMAYEEEYQVELNEKNMQKDFTMSK